MVATTSKLARAPRRPGLLVLSAVVTALGCASGGMDLSDLPVQEYRGHLTWTGDVYWFEPCSPVAGSERLWVTVTDRSVGQIEEARYEGRLTAQRPVFVHWRAALITSGRVGPGGPALLARELIQLRAPADSDCAGESGTSH